MRKTVRVVLSTATLLLAACASSVIGHDFNDANLAGLQVGHTTLDQTVALLGAPPDKSVRTPRGNWAHEWRFIRADGNGLTGHTESRTKDVVLVFTHDNVLIGLVRASGVSLSAADMRRLAAVPPGASTTAQ